MPSSFNSGIAGTYYFRIYGEGTAPNNDTNLYAIQITTY